ncbi:MAG: hypothetical protein WKF71_05760 [Pyrinomonadaceae bacterium]
MKATTLLFQHNVEAMIWRRHFEVASERAEKSVYENAVAANV